MIPGALDGQGTPEKEEDGCERCHNVDCMIDVHSYGLNKQITVNTLKINLIFLVAIFLFPSATCCVP